MKKNSVRGLSLFLTAAIACTLFSGCNPGTSAKDKNAGGQPTPSAQASVYPLKTDVTLRYFYGFNGQASPYASTSSELALFKELEKRTGVKIEFIENTSGDNFNLMVASGDMPDMMKRNIFNYQGGPDKAIADGIALKLNDIMETYAPNLYNYLKAHPDIDKMVKTDSGAYYCFPFIRPEPYLQVYQGPMIRKDWLDELGLKVPATIDDWYKVLGDFKTKKGATAPLTFPIAQLNSSACFIGAYGIRRGLYVDNGKVKFGEMEPGYKDFLQTFRTWYAQGLLDKDFFSVNASRMEQQIVEGTSGAAIYNTGAGLGKWNGMGVEKDAKYKLVAAPYPTLKAGEIPKFGQMDLPFMSDMSVSIWANSPHKEIAARWLDYAYSPEGHMLFNFGIEGESYTMVNGYPRYTDLIMKNPNGLTPAQIMANYMLSSTNGPFIQDRRYMEQYASTPEQQESLNVWTKTDAAKTTLPKVILTQEENAEASQIISEVNSYVSSMQKKFIVGEEPMDNFDQFVAQLKKLGIERYVSLYQAALERYNKR